MNMHSVHTVQICTHIPTTLFLLDSDRLRGRCKRLTKSETGKSTQVHAGLLYVNNVIDCQLYSVIAM